MRGGNEEHRAGLRNSPRASGNNFSEKGVDEVSDDIEEEVVLPIDHGIELLWLLVRGRLGPRLRVLGLLRPGLGGHAEGVWEGSRGSAAAFDATRKDAQGRAGSGRRGSDEEP